MRAVEPALFAPLTEGERLAALRVLTEDNRLASMAKVGRYRVIAVEPFAAKAHSERAGRRMARVLVYDYAAERAVEACVDLDGEALVQLSINRTQPLLAREEEAAAIAAALDDERVKRKLALGDVPQATMHYWGRRDTELAYSRRSAAVIFGQTDSAPSLVAVVDLIDGIVTEVVASEQW
jgi:hypothetical protein